MAASPSSGVVVVGAAAAHPADALECGSLSFPTACFFVKGVHEYTIGSFFVVPA